MKYTVVEKIDAGEWVVIGASSQQVAEQIAENRRRLLGVDVFVRPEVECQCGHLEAAHTFNRLPLGICYGTDDCSCNGFQAER